jgi:predicted metalloprotease
MVRGGGIGCGTLLFLVVLSVVFKQDFVSLLGPALMTEETSVPAGSPDFASGPEEEELVDFMSFVLDDIQATWTSVLPGAGTSYQDTQMVLFRDAVRSACGMAGSQTGPFYCPGDAKVYLDLSFFDELHRRFGAPGDFAQAYVIAHEVGHHVQNILGIEREVRRLQGQRPDAANDLSVRMELQADCLAGVWGHSTAERGILERGDVEEGLNAAAAIGDDRIQRQTQGHVTPDSFTHGSSAQRVEWFKKGLVSGDPNACDPFSER